MPQLTVEADGKVIPFDAPAGASEEQIRTLAARALKAALPGKNHQRPILERGLMDKLIPKPSGELRAPPATLANFISDKITGALSSFGVDEGYARRLGNKTTSALSDFTPVGAATSADDARTAFNRGDYAAALGNAGLAALQAIPDVGKGAAVGAHAIIAPLWHGSPHKFEKFALEKIGTGEGAQAYGHGLYFAENPEVARQYQSTVGLQHAGVDWGNDPASAAAYWIGMSKDREAAIRTFETMKKQHQATLDRAAKGLPMASGAVANSRNEIAQADAAIEHIRNGTERQGMGHLYKVEVNANPGDFLNWDAPLATQGRVRNAIEALGLPKVEGWKESKAYPDHITGEHIYRATLPSGWLTQRAMQSGEFAKGSEMLRGAGLPGIRYLDQGSRGAGQGTSNYVVFDPDLIDILQRY